MTLVAVLGLFLYMFEIPKNDINLKCRGNPEHILTNANEFLCNEFTGRSPQVRIKFFLQPRSQQTIRSRIKMFKGNDNTFTYDTGGSCQQTCTATRTISEILGNTEHKTKFIYVQW